MAEQEFEAERLLKRMAALNLKGARRDPDQVEKSLRELYQAVGQPFPGFRWVADLRETALGRMRAGWARLVGNKGALQTLTDEVLASPPTRVFKSAWTNYLERFEMACGNEPEEFMSRLSRAGNQARQAAYKVLKAEKLGDLLEDALRKAAQTVVKDAGALIPPADRKDATDTLANATRNCAVLPTSLLPREADEWAQWRARHGADGRPPRDTVPALLHLIDAFDAGLWLFWPCPEEAVAVARPML